MPLFWQREFSQIYIDRYQSYGPQFTSHTIPIKISRLKALFYFFSLFPSSWLLSLLPENRIKHYIRITAYQQKQCHLKPGCIRDKTV